MFVFPVHFGGGGCGVSENACNQLLEVFHSEQLCHTLKRLSHIETTEEACIFRVFLP